jgi:1-acyl-sn-glycerol-3-phosphate acyltransferase
VTETTITTDLEFRKPNKIMQAIGRGLFQLMGWKIDYRLPDDPKMVLIFAPHTSNSDAFHALPAAFVLGLKPSWLVKNNIYVWPLKKMIDWLGGVPVDRHKSENKVEMMASAIKKTDQIILGLSPEGTRSYIEYWRSGFYHIARLANVPIHFGFIDYPTKTVGAHPGFIPSGDIEADMEKIRAFYKDKRGRHPQNQGPVQFRPRS